MAATESILRKRIQRFRRLKRGYYSFLILIGAYLISFLLPFLINDKALVVRFEGKYYVPIWNYYPASEFKDTSIGEPNYRQLAKRLTEEKSGNWVIMPLYPYSPTES